MSRNKTTGLPPRDPVPVTAAEGSPAGSGSLTTPDPRALTEQEAAATSGVLRVFERVTAGEQGGHLTTSEHPDLLAAANR